MAKPFETLRDNMRPEARIRTQVKTSIMLEEMTLDNMLLHSHNPGTIQSSVTLCCVQIKVGDIVDFMYNPSHREDDRYTIRAVFLGQQTDGRIVVTDLKGMKHGTLLQCDMIIDVRIVSMVKETHAPDDQ